MGELNASSVLYYLTTSSARRATRTFLPERRTLALENSVYEFESWRETPAIAGGEFSQLSYFNA
jgi:hypothetical protein